MEWERLIRFGVLGNANLEGYAILLARGVLGLFFAVSGANKLFVAGRRQAMHETLVAAKLPFPRLMTYLVSAVEFVGGCLLIVGLLSSLVSLALLVDMIAAILTTSLSAMPRALSPLNWLDDFLYLPEVLYALFFVWLICSGPGKFSVDYLIVDRWLR
jgi:putative oxidoreductase